MPYVADASRYASMRYNRTGRSGLKLSALSLGLWHNFGGVDKYETSRAMVLAAFDMGITHFDLANNYGPPAGSAEETFGQIMRHDMAPYRDEIIVSSKAEGVDMVTVVTEGLVVLVGRGAVIPIVNTATICISFSLVVSLVVLLRLRKMDPAPPAFVAPGGLPAMVVALIGMSAMAVIAAVDPILRAKALPVEWLILLAWAAIGWLFLWRASGLPRKL